LPEWLIERGIGETRAVLVEGSEIIGARLILDGQAAAGAVLKARLKSVGRNAIAVADGTEYLLPKGAPGVTQGASLTIEVTREAIGSEPPEPESPHVELPSDLYALEMPQALKHALERERESESYFRFMAERVPETELGRLFMELAETEWKHKTDLQAEYDSVAGPDQFLMDI